MNYTYGELCEGELSILLHSYPSLSSIHNFLDCGSGKGKLCQEAASLGIFKKILGVELHLQRLAISLKLKQQDLQKMKDVSFYYHDLSKPLDFFKSPTLAYCCATCFEPQLIEELSHHLTNNPHIRGLISLKPFPLSARHWKLSKMLRIKCSWDHAIAYIYLKNE